MSRLLIVKTGTTLAPLRERRGDFEDWITRGMGVDRRQVSVASVYLDAALPDPAEPSGVVVTGSSAMVSDREAWSERTAEWLGGVVEAATPLLGICYGHQLLAQALGGVVGQNPRGREIGTIDVSLTESAKRDALLGGFAVTMRIQATHMESVLELPASAELLGSSEGDPHSAFSVGPAAWGVQFHPELDAELIRGYIHERRDLLRSEGIDPSQRIEQVAECPDGAAVLRRFAQLLHG